VPVRARAQTLKIRPFNAESRSCALDWLNIPVGWVTKSPDEVKFGVGRGEVLELANARTQTRRSDRPVGVYSTTSPFMWAFIQQLRLFTDNFTPSIGENFTPRGGPDSSLCLTGSSYARF
jgi:hypothetical protein